MSNLASQNYFARLYQNLLAAPTPEVKQDLTISATKTLGLKYYLTKAWRIPKDVTTEYLTTYRLKSVDTSYFLSLVAYIPENSAEGLEVPYILERGKMYKVQLLSGQGELDAGCPLHALVSDRKVMLSFRSIPESFGLGSDSDICLVKDYRED